MKKCLFLVAALMLCTSCLKDLSIPEVEKDILVETTVQNCETAKEFKVPVQKDAITVVISNGDTLAVTSTPLTIKVPKSISTTSTRNNDNWNNDNWIVKYVNKDNLDYEILSKRSYCASWQAVMFEDSKDGDYDFNDVILHIYAHTDFPWGKNYALQTVDIHPIALGSEKRIGLGCVLSDGTMVYITNDIRKHLFFSQGGFLNTLEDHKPLRLSFNRNIIREYKLALSADKAYWVAWFIFLDGQQANRLYAISGDLPKENYAHMVDKNLLPYGLVISDDNGTFKYPKEKISIKEVYPDFMDWALNGKPNIGKPILDNVYPLSYLKGIDGLDGLKHSIWDYRDIEAGISYPPKIK